MAREKSTPPEGAGEQRDLARKRSRLKDVFKVAAVVVLGAVAVERATNVNNQDVEASKGDDGKVVNVDIAKVDQPADGVQFETPDKPEIKTVQLSDLDKDQGDKGDNGKESPATRGELDEILKKKAGIFVDRHGVTHEDLFRDSGQEILEVCLGSADAADKFERATDKMLEGGVQVLGGGVVA